MKDYKKILEGIVNIISNTEKSDTVSNICSYIDENCPELTESKDERIRKWLIEYFNQYTIDGMPVTFGNGLNVKDVIAWLEKQGEPEPLYVRFGDIPSNEKSKIYRGEEEIGEEDGVSVYPAFEVNGNIVLGLTLPITKSTLYTQQHLLEYENRPCYLVKGDCVGKDADGQPLIRNIQIIKKIDNYRVKEEEKADNANNSAPKIESDFLFKVKKDGKEYNVRGIFGDVTVEIEDKPGHFIYANLDDCEIIKGGYDIKESGSPYPTKPATFSEQESVKSKFQVGDWIVEPIEDEPDVLWHIEKIDDSFYWDGFCGASIEIADKYYHVWTLDDANDGDILVSCVNKPFIYNGNYDDTHAGAYCGVGFGDEFIIDHDKCNWTEKKDIRPATKEQRDFLFERMKEADYMWDFSNKKPVKIKTN